MPEEDQPIKSIKYLELPLYMDQNGMTLAPMITLINGGYGNRNIVIPIKQRSNNSRDR